MRQNRDTTEMGENRTGISIDPAEARKTADGARKEATRGSERVFSDARARSILDSQGVGSLPKPARRTNGKNGLKEAHLRVLLDKLGERAAFERMGVRLYDAMIAKIEALGQSLPLPELRRIRGEEQAHFHLVSGHLKRLGGDSTAESPCADVTGVASRGILQVLADPRTSVAQCLSALLTAELTDNAGWELLIELCDKLDQTSMSAEFLKALEEEGDHLLKLRGWISRELQRTLA